MPCRSFIGEVELGGELGNGPTLCCILRFRVDMGERELRCESGEHELWLGMGLAATTEDFVGDVPRNESLEASASLRYDAFHFDDPELHVSAELMVFPSLTVDGRTRTELVVDLRRELVRDLFWLLTLYGSFDNKPVGENAEKEDISVVASLGWKF